jgi:hypothetical protein
LNISLLQVVAVAVRAVAALVRLRVVALAALKQATCQYLQVLHIPLQ